MRPDALLQSSMMLQPTPTMPIFARLLMMPPICLVSSPRNSPSTQFHYSTFVREFLGISKVLHHFQHIVDRRHLDIFTNHKPITCESMLPNAKYLDREICQLEYVNNFTSNIRLLAGKDNIVADALARLAIHAIAGALFPFFETLTRE